MFKEGLINNVSDYLDLYIEKSLPAQEIKEAVKNKHAISILENLRKSLSIDKIMATDTVREAVIDGKKQIDEATTHIKKLEKEKNTLVESLNAKEANLALDRLTDGLPATKKRHMIRVFNGKSAEFVNENFQYTLDMFEKSEKDKLETLKEQATENKKVVDRPARGNKKVVQESVQDQIEQTNPDNKQDKGLFDNYMGELTRW
jgi:Fe2+ transport system protein B